MIYLIWLQTNWVLALGLVVMVAQAIRLAFWWRWLSRDRRAFDARMEAMQKRIHTLRDVREGKS